VLRRFRKLSRFPSVNLAIGTLREISSLVVSPDLADLEPFDPMTELGPIVTPAPFFDFLPMHS
jgi:hypothetical protein